MFFLFFFIQICDRDELIHILLRWVLKEIIQVENKYIYKENKSVLQDWIVLTLLGQIILC